MARQGVQFEMLGLSDLKVSLDALRDDIKDKLADALDDTAHSVQAGARTRVPRDKGDLARAIQLGGKGLTRFVGLSDERISSRGGHNSAHQNPWVYGLWVEFGLKVRKMAARPYMGPAADDEVNAHNERVEKVLDEAVAKA